VAGGLKGNGAAVIWPEKEADGREQLGWRGTLLLLFRRCWGRMEERPGDGNEGVRGDCSVKERGECRGGCSSLGKEAGNEGWLQETGQESLFCANFELPPFSTV